MATSFNDARNPPPQQDDEDLTVDSPDGYIPEGYKSVADFIKEARETYQADLDYDRTNRDEALLDLQFIAMDQWDAKVRAEREAQNRPCLTINVLPQYVGQVVGDRRINKTAIKVRPKRDATVDDAEVRAGLIKSIESFSRAERVYDDACEDQVTCGIGNFRVVMDYADDDAFEQDIRIKQIPNPLSVIWDYMSVDPTGRDAQHCFVDDMMPRKVFEKIWPHHQPPANLGEQDYGSWFTKDVVRVTEWWKLKRKPAKIAMFMDGSIREVTDMDPVSYIENVVRDEQGQPVLRDTHRTYAQMHLITGFAILDPMYELPLTRLPIIKVTGREFRVGDDRVRFGLVRWARDPQRMKNYWRSIAAETLAMAPRNQWLSPASAVEGRQEAFRTGHKSGDPLLIYNDGPGKPERVAQAEMPAAVLNEAQMNTQDIKDTTGLHDASLGAPSNETSGKAIMARQREGDVATVIYHDNLNYSIQEGGDVVNQLLGVCYDTPRELRVIGVDDKHKLVRFNDPQSPDSVNLATGKYDVEITSGPSYTTQRMEAADAMMEAMKVAPQLMQVAPDLIIKLQDWPGAEELANRMKKIVPANLLDPEDQPKPTPEQLAAQQQEQEQKQAATALQEQMAHHEQEMQIETAEAGVTEAKAKAQMAQELARKATADADKAEADADAARVEAHHMSNMSAHEYQHRNDPPPAPSNGSNKRGGGPRPVARPAKGGRK